ncbi:hypothetical protein F4810DRAFT_709389 [Camillea tinctor]|nr:hypothetical protein F4810DRAFT_709389 [Camillea tinctor]
MGRHISSFFRLPIECQRHIIQSVPGWSDILCKADREEEEAAQAQVQSIVASNDDKSNQPTTPQRNSGSPAPEDTKRPSSPEYRAISYEDIQGKRRIHIRRNPRPPPEPPLTSSLRDRFPHYYSVQDSLGKAKSSIGKLLLEILSSLEENVNQQEQQQRSRSSTSSDDADGGSDDDLITTADRAISQLKGQDAEKKESEDLPIQTFFRLQDKLPSRRRDTSLPSREEIHERTRWDEFNGGFTDDMAIKLALRQSRAMVDYMDIDRDDNDNGIKTPKD